jgi:undecaprenyl-diphosphatase
MFNTFTRAIQGWIILSILLLMSVSLSATHGGEADRLAAVSNSIKTSPPGSLGYKDAVVLGVVEGLTEYLPVSSTGHLIIADQILLPSSQRPLDPDIQSARNAYLVAIQGGAILAVLILYWKRIQSIVKGCLGRNPAGWRLGIRILVAFVPSSTLGLLFQDWLEAHLFHPRAVAVALLTGAIIMLFVEWKNRRKISSRSTDRSDDLEHLTLRQALIIGCFQCLALWPGMSRSMSTIVGAYWVGLRPVAAAEFSFLLGLLTLSAASVWSLVHARAAVWTHLSPGPSITGAIIAMVVAMIAVRWFVSFLCRHGLAWFAVYRIILGIAVLTSISL